ncbi:hypothetical protein VTJ49DRAFT_1138 [Mycothermus thermophilus]|uniref:Transcription factor hoxa13 n=1 Tax=Humicola insolens TaxID=85995 RepID=A0ABR3VP11_HUMIN
MDHPSGALKKTPNAANGLNGVAKSSTSSPSRPSSSLDNHAAAHRAKLARRRPGLVSRLFNLAARLLTWYFIITILFRCPPSLDACDDDAPRICRPYLHVRNAVAPYVEPYYDAYAAPYVEIARPYYVAVDEAIVTPAWAYTKQHAAPHLQQLQTVARTQWDKTVQPHVDHYHGLVKARYDETLAPHIARAAAAAQPYYEIARTNVLQTYHGALVPAYHFALPHLLDGYRAASAFAGNTLVPTAAWAWDKTYAFLNGTVSPRIRAVYTENVEPQLVKIGKRLGRYNNNPTKKSVPKPKPSQTPADGSAASAETTTTFVKPAVSVTASSSSPSTAPTATSARRRPANSSARPRVSLEPIPPPEVDEQLEQEDPHRREARETIAADLRDWQERYTKAAGEGLAEIDDRVQEIAKRMIRREARITGRTLLTQLQTAATTQLTDLRAAIRNIVAAVAQGTTTPDEGRDAIIAAVRAAGMAVKERAQAVRAWRERYDAEMQAAVTSAAETHFTILENIRDLALQKIGMKWAWMDSVTYKDWAKYHLLKSRFDEWKVDLEKHVVSHPGLVAAQLEAANIEDEAMQTAAATAKELARLKQVGQLKLIARDDSDEFDSDVTRQAAEAAEAAQAGQGHAEEASQKTDEQAAEKPVVQDGPVDSDEQSASTNPSESADPSPGPAVESSQSFEDAQTNPTDAADDARSIPIAETKSESINSDTPAAESAEPIDPAIAQQSQEPTESAADEPTEPSPLHDPTDPSLAQDTPDLASSQIFDTPVMAVVDNETDEPEVETKEEEGADKKADPVAEPVRQKKPVEEPEAIQEAEPGENVQKEEGEGRDEQPFSSTVPGKEEL